MTGRAAERILVFVNGHLVAAPRPSVKRPDVAKLNGPEALRAGFNVKTPSAADLHEPAADDVRVFGLIDGRAIELPRLGTAAEWWDYQRPGGWGLRGESSGARTRAAWRNG